MAQKPWRVDESDQWEDMSDAERSQFLTEKRHLDQAQRQYRAQQKDLQIGLQRFISLFEAQAKRTHRKLKANAFWRDD